MRPSLDQRIALRKRPHGKPVMFQRWSRLLFLHWELPAEDIARTLPAGLRVDTFGGKAFVGLVPFFMERIRPRGLPAAPWLSWFLEMNVRTYVHDDEGRAGVWFYSLDCNQPVAVELARRFFHLPYIHARMSAVREGDGVRYQSVRRNARNDENSASRFIYRPEGKARTAEPGSLEFFLLERYLLFSEDKAGRIGRGLVHHVPYPFQAAKVEQLSTRPLSDNGFALQDAAPMSAIHSSGVDVEVFALE